MNGILKELMYKDSVNFFFEKSYQTYDVFIIAGLILALLGLGSILIEVCTLVKKDQVGLRFFFRKTFLNIQTVLKNLIKLGLIID